MNILESPIFVDLLKKLATETNRAATDSSASVETSPIKDLLTSLEKVDFSNLDIGKLIGAILPNAAGSGLGGMLGALTQAIGIGGPSVEETKANRASALSEVSAAGQKLSALNATDLTPERSRLVGILTNVIDFVLSNVKV